MPFALETKNGVQKRQISLILQLFAILAVLPYKGPSPPGLQFCLYLFISGGIFPLVPGRAKHLRKPAQSFYQYSFKLDSLLTHFIPWSP